MELVAIKVKIPLNAIGQHDYPNFNSLPGAVRANMDWSKFIDAHGTGWHYDKVCGHGYTDEDNAEVAVNHEHRNLDRSCWFGAICVPEAFALAAEAAFPTLVTLMDEASFTSFYDDRAHAHESEETVDKDILDSILTQQQAEAAGLLPAPTSQKLQARNDALNPAKPNRGIRKNMNRRFADYKSSRGITLKNIPRP